MALSHKEMTKHIRGRLKACGIKARCSLYTACGTRYIKIGMDRERFFGAREWTEQEALEIGRIAQVNHLTEAQGSPIDLNIQRQLTKSHEFNFEFHPELQTD